MLMLLIETTVVKTLLTDMKLEDFLDKLYCFWAF